MMVVNFTHGLFLTCTQKSRVFTSHTSRYTVCIQMYNDFIGRTIPCTNKITPLLTWRASFFAHGDELPSTLVSGLPTTAPPLGFYLSHPFTPHSLYYIIYKDNINNLSRLHPGHCTQGLVCIYTTYRYLIFTQYTSIEPHAN